MARVLSWSPAAAVCASCPQVVAAWVFGSAVGGSVREGGDVDIGIFFDQTPDLDTLAALRADLQSALGFDDIDVVSLNRAGPILQFEAVSGTALHCRDPERRAAFVSLVARQYEDELAFYQKGLNAWG